MQDPVPDLSHFTLMPMFGVWETARNGNRWFLKLPPPGPKCSRNIPKIALQAECYLVNLQIPLDSSLFEVLSCICKAGKKGIAEAEYKTRVNSRIKV